MKPAILLLMALIPQEDPALKASEKTEHFTIRYRPGGRAGAAVDRDLVLERRGGEIAIWIDGFRIVSGSVDDAPGPVGIGVAGGTARFEWVRVRELK